MYFWGNTATFAQLWLSVWSELNYFSKQQESSATFITCYAQNIFTNCQKKLTIPSINIMQVCLPYLAIMQSDLKSPLIFLLFLSNLTSETLLDLSDPWRRPFAVLKVFNRSKLPSRLESSEWPIQRCFLTHSFLINDFTLIFFYQEEETVCIYLSFWNSTSILNLDSQHDFKRCLPI